MKHGWPQPYRTCSAAFNCRPANTALILSAILGTCARGNTWFTAAARTVKPDSPTGEYPTVTYALAFRKLMNAAYATARGKNSECQEAVEETISWDAHLDTGGIAFAPEMALIPFAKLAPYLSAEGRAGLASFIAKVKALNRKPVAAKEHLRHRSAYSGGRPLQPLEEIARGVLRRR